jgi:threonine/homoserine efflux transporter RhtA
MKEILSKLKSRKLWLAIAGIATGVAIALGADASDIETVAGAIGAVVCAVTYIVTEGKVDAEAVKNTIIAVDEAVDVFTEGEAE